MIASALAPRIIAADAVAVEIVRHLPRLAEKRGLDPTLVLAALVVTPVEWRPPSEYSEMRTKAERQIGVRDQDDWPTVALALTLGLPVWSQDKDFDDADVTVLTTGELLDALREVGEDV